MFAPVPAHMLEARSPTNGLLTAPPLSATTRSPLPAEARRRLHHAVPISLSFSAASAYFLSPRVYLPLSGSSGLRNLQIRQLFCLQELGASLSSLALFSAFVSFVFNRLRPLFPKHPGVGGTHAPSSSLYPSDSVFPSRRCSVSPLLVPSYFAGLSRFCIPSPIVPVPPSQLHLLLLQEACL
jgi:hypothetical protein